MRICLIGIWLAFFVHSAARAQEIRSIDNDKNAKPPMADFTKKPHKYVYDVFDSATDAPIKKEKEVIDWVSSDKKKNKVWVLNTDSKDRAVFWVDSNGVHTLYDAKKKVVNTPIDLSYRSPSVGQYQMHADTTGSYLYVHWYDEMKENNKPIKTYYYYALVNKEGEILWKKIDAFDRIKPSKPKYREKTGKIRLAKPNQNAEPACIETIWPSCNGDMLALLNLNCDEDVNLKAEVWNSKGKLVADIPGIFSNSYWSEDGKKIYLTGYKKDEKTLESKLAVFARDGQLLRLR